MCVFFNGSIYVFFLKVHLCLYSFLPFVLLIAGTALLALFVYRSKKAIQSELQPEQSSHSHERNKHMNTTIICLALLFILMTAPNAFAQIFRAQLRQTELGYGVLMVLSHLAFSFHAFNFFIVYVTNKKFQSEFKFIIRCFSNQQQIITKWKFLFKYLLFFI